jgi:gliding motility-associated lipoprotein GldH
MTKTGTDTQLLTKHGLLLLITAIIFLSCEQKPVYNEFRITSPKGWEIGSRCEFEVALQDTTPLYDVYLSVRHAGNYPYQNLWLFVERVSPDSTIVNDTIACGLTDYRGKWSGRGSGSVYLQTVPYRQWKVGMSGKYVFKIKHGMRDEALKGVHAIGLRIESRDGEK